MTKKELNMVISRYLKNINMIIDIINKQLDLLETKIDGSTDATQNPTTNTKYSQLKN